jgi:very-short-patch-repair endonuclease
MQRFGPINGAAGKRRLNVLFSRAKERIVTFSSMTASDIRAEEDENSGVYMLKYWLEYSNSNLLEGGQYSQREPDSDFEEHVINQIKSIGFEAIPQVGVKGYFIDIGIKHHDWPHGFIMGIECDGATYHSSRSARDRDRLRQEVLEGLGWNLYRIWSTDWFEDPRRETDKLRKVIEERLIYLTSIKTSSKVTNQ